jgi:tRNA 2-thiouridine synthesizing protein D
LGPVISMIYSLLVLSSPASGHGARTAAAFARCLLSRGHQLYRVFFLDAGTEAGSSVAVLPQDEADRLRPWIDLSEQHGVELVLCISSALKRGMLDENGARRHEKIGPTAHPAFIVSGLGQLHDAAANSDRLITFGG